MDCASHRRTSVGVHSRSFSSTKRYEWPFLASMQMSDDKPKPPKSVSEVLESLGMDRDQLREMAKDAVADLTPKKGRGAAWEKVLDAAAERLGPNWTIIGNGLRAELLHTPVRWFFDTVGIDPIPNRERLIVGHTPLFEPLVPRAITLTQDSSDSRLRDKEFRRLQIDIFDTDSAAALVTRWAQGPATELFAFKPIDAIAAWFEDAYLARDEQHRTNWKLLAGLRVIADTGSPLEVIDSQLDYLRSRAADPAGLLVMFWEQFREVAAAGDRETTLRWLDEHRRATVREHYALPDSVFADVLDDLGNG